MNSKLEVWLDANFLDQMERVGTLAHDRGQVRFHYHADWLSHPQRFSFDMNMSLDQSVFYPQPEASNFGIFLDSSPDRWGQTLMKRRELIEAKNENRKPRNLHAWDFLIGVQDFTRQGALRFKLEGTEDFLGAHELSAPPVTSLGELESVARELSSKRIDDLNLLKRWLSVLVAPGSSLGGARPKANFTEKDGSLWIAKFPAKDDERDIGAWEMVAHTLAKQAGIEVPPARAIKFGKDFHTFCIQRFDRDNGKRVFYASAMTMLGRTESEGASYLDMAQFIMSNGDKLSIKANLEQLFKRVVFNICIANRDDHLRNHGFVWTQNGWELSPAFDVNPNTDKLAHVLNIDEADNQPILENALATASFYGLNDTQAQKIVQDIMDVVSQWSSVASRLRIAKADIKLMESVFSAAIL